MTEEENIWENQHLQEMSKLSKRMSGLPVNLWLDDSGTWKSSKHWKKIKFQRDRGDKSSTRNMIPMSIEDEPKILVQNPKLEITQAEIKEVREFVSINKDLLIKLSDQQLDIDEFIKKMKKLKTFEVALPLEESV